MMKIPLLFGELLTDGSNWHNAFRYWIKSNINFIAPIFLDLYITMTLLPKRSLNF
jgi:hypothetical protein